MTGRDDDPYAVLGVTPDAGDADIRRAYLALARAHHPDRMSGRSADDQARAATRMARVNAAWTELSDPVRRAALDARLGGEPRRDDVRDPGGSFRPLDDEDDVDPRLLDDTPTGAPTVRRGLTMLPASLAGAGAVVLGLGAVLRLGAVAGAGFGLFVASGLSFLLLPVVALFASSRADRE